MYDVLVRLDSSAIKITHTIVTKCIELRFCESMAYVEYRYTPAAQEYRYNCYNKCYSEDDIRITSLAHVPVELGQKINIIEYKLHDHAERILTLENKLQSLLENLDDKILAVCKYGSDVLYPQLVTSIESSPDKKTFYEYVEGRLNAIYLASSVVASDVVCHDLKGSAGWAGYILKGLSFVPVVGPGLKITGELLEGGEAITLKLKLIAISHICSDPMEWCRVSARVAIELALELDNLKIVVNDEDGGNETSNATNDAKLVELIPNVKRMDASGVMAIVNSAIAAGLKKVKDYKESTNANLIGALGNFATGAIGEYNHPNKNRPIERKANIVVDYLVNELSNTHKIIDGSVDTIANMLVEKAKAKYCQGNHDDVVNNKQHTRGYVALLEAKEHNDDIEESKKCECCIISMLDEIEYDNPILNARAELYKFYQRFGSDASNALLSIGELMFQEANDSAVMHVVGDCSLDVHDV